MNTYQRQLLHQLINELTATTTPNLHAAQMLAAELKGAMQAQKELDDIHPITCDCAECIPTQPTAPDLLDALIDATDNCLWRSDSDIPLSADESQRIYNKAMTAIAKAKQLTNNNQ